MVERASEDNREGTDVLTAFSYRRSLVERLRTFDPSDVPPHRKPALLRQAANEIERLEEECFRLFLKVRTLNRYQGR